MIAGYYAYILPCIQSFLSPAYEALTTISSAFQHLEGCSCKRRDATFLQYFPSFKAIVTIAAL
jgi:hypothetical protein